MADKATAIVFDKLAGQDPDGESTRLLALESEKLAPELEEIAELRRVVAELAEPEPSSYTTS